MTCPPLSLSWTGSCRICPAEGNTFPGGVGAWLGSRSSLGCARAAGCAGDADGVGEAPGCDGGAALCSVTSGKALPLAAPAGSPLTRAAGLVTGPEHSSTPAVMLHPGRRGLSCPRCGVGRRSALGRLGVGVGRSCRRPPNTTSTLAAGPLCGQEPGLDPAPGPGSPSRAGPRGPAAQLRTGQRARGRALGVFVPRLSASRETWLGPHSHFAAAW